MAASDWLGVDEEKDQEQELLNRAVEAGLFVKLVHIQVLQTTSDYDDMVPTVARVDGR